MIPNPRPHWFQRFARSGAWAVLRACAVLRPRILGLGQPRGNAPAWLALSIAALGSAKPAAAAPRGVPALPRVVTTLDANQGRRALAAYGQYMDRFCKSLGHSGTDSARQLREAGFSSAADPEVLCAVATRFARPIASGSFVAAWSQEVLLEVPSGCDAAYGERTLAVMRETRSGYRLVTHLLSGGRFDAHARVATTPGLDRLVLCQSSGNMGVYPARCGFFDQGSFSGPGANPEASADTKNEFELVATTTCGRSSSVSLGKVTLRDQRLQVELVIEQSMGEPSGPDESPDDPVCSKRIVQARESFTLVYELHGASIQRLTPIPKPVQAVLERY